MTPPSKKVSVLTTVFNREAYLEECLGSIRDSHFGDFEVIVVDDGSTDRSIQFVEKFLSSDPRFQLHQNRRNLGDYPNRNRAASLANGKYIKYVDADDIIYPHSLAIMVEAMERHPEAALGICHSVPEDDLPYPILLRPDEAYEKHFLRRGCLNCGPSGAIIRRDAFEETRGFGDWGLLGDLDLWMRLAAKHPIVLLPPGLVWWRRHSGQEFTADGAKDFYLEYGYLLTMQSLQSPECPLSPQKTQEAIRKHRQHHARRLLALAIKNRRPVTALKYFKNSRLSPLELLSGLRPYL